MNTVKNVLISVWENEIAKLLDRGAFATVEELRNELDKLLRENLPSYYNVTIEPDYKAKDKKVKIDILIIKGDEIICLMNIKIYVAENSEAVHYVEAYDFQGSLQNLLHSIGNTIATEQGEINYRLPSKYLICYAVVDYNQPDIIFEVPEGKNVLLLKGWIDSESDYELLFHHEFRGDIKTYVNSIENANDGFLIDFVMEEKHIPLKLIEQDVQESKERKNVYYYGYRFEENIHPAIRQDFIKAIQYETNFTTQNLYRKFISDIVRKLDKKLKITEFFVFASPYFKSNLLSQIIFEASQYVFCVETPFVKLQRLHEKIKLNKKLTEMENLMLEAIQGNTNILMFYKISDTSNYLEKTIDIIQQYNNGKIYVFQLIENPK